MKRNTHTGSQHFLRSPRLAQELLGETSIRSSDTVYDIGAGSGVMTSTAAKQAASVVAIEIDSATASKLKENIRTARLDNVTVITGDYLNMPAPKMPYKIFANIPFHISAAIVGSFVNSPHAPEAAYLIVQKQFGQKLVSSEKGKFTSQLGMILGAEYAVKILKNLQRTDFAPPPAVDTVFIEIKKRPQPLIPEETLLAYRSFTEKAFSDPKFLARQPLDVIGMTPGLSPSRLTLSQWVLLFTASRQQKRSSAK